MHSKSPNMQDSYSTPVVHIAWLVSVDTACAIPVAAYDSRVARVPLSVYSP